MRAIAHTDGAVYSPLDMTVRYGNPSGAGPHCSLSASGTTLRVFAPTVGPSRVEFVRAGAHRTLARVLRDGTLETDDPDLAPLARHLVEATRAQDEVACTQTGAEILTRVAATPPA